MPSNRGRRAEQVRARRRARRRAAAVGAAALVVAGGLAARPWRLLEDEPALGRRGSEELAGAPDVDPTGELAAWAIVYRRETLSGGTVLVDTEEVSVRRPFESRRVTKDGAPPGGPVVATQVAAFGVRTDTGGASPLGLMVPPGVPAADVRLGPAVDEAVEQGLLERREVRRVAGRRCQVWRSGTSLSAATLSKPEPADHTDTCVDGRGLVLEEVTVVEGRPLSRRVAVAVDESPAFDDADFDAGDERLPADKGGGSVQRIKEGTGPPGDQFLPGSEPPLDGFTLHGRYVVVPPQPELFADLSREGERRAAFTTVWTRGIDVLYLEQGGTLQGSDPFPGAGGPTVDLPAPVGAPAQLLPSAQGNQVRAELAGGRWVSVGGTLPVARLLEVARALRLAAGPGNLEVEPL